MPRRVLEGVVVSDKMDKTIVVEVERKYMHPLYKKFVRTTKKYHVRDEAGRTKNGDKVSFAERSPLSKSVSWELITGDKK